MTLKIGWGGAKAKINASQGEEVTCVRMQDLLRAHNITTVDLWVLDVEGSEMPVIRSFPWSDFDVKTFMVEDFWIPSRVVNFIMTANGYSMSHQMAVDTIFVKTSQTPWNKKFRVDNWNLGFASHTNGKYQGGLHGNIVPDGDTPVQL